jgi:hypothetical protein
MYNFGLYQIVGWGGGGGGKLAVSRVSDFGTETDVQLLFSCVITNLILHEPYFSWFYILYVR